MAKPLFLFNQNKIVFKLNANQINHGWEIPWLGNPMARPLKMTEHYVKTQSSTSKLLINHGSTVTPSKKHIKSYAIHHCSPILHSLKLRHGAASTKAPAHGAHSAGAASGSAGESRPRGLGSAPTSPLGLAVENLWKKSCTKYFHGINISYFG